MRRSIGLALAAIFLSTFSFPALSWYGPQVSLDNKNGRKVIKICEQGGSCTQSTPFFLALNTGVVGHTWETFMYEAQLQLNHVSPSTNGVVPILEVHLANRSDAFLDELVSHLSQLTPQPYLLVRYHLDTPPDPGADPMTMVNMQGDARSGLSGAGAPWALNNAWFAAQERDMERTLNRLDSFYPQYRGKVVGLHIMYKDGGEWFFRPYGYNTATNTMFGEGSIDPATGCYLYAWTNYWGNQPCPIGRHAFYLFDYSQTTKSGFCSWNQLPAALSGPGCRAPTVVERNNATPGIPLPDLGKTRGVFLDPADIASLRAAYYNRYQSQQNVDAIVRLLGKAKQVSGNRILTATFYGYQNLLINSLSFSGHTAETALLASNAIDILMGAYSYDIESSRALGHPMVSTGPTDAPRVGNKLWFDEDDTRTHLAGGIPWQTVYTLWDSIRILRRNLLTAGLHNRGSYFLDLQGTGWFGRPDNSGDSDALWANLYNAFTAIDKLQLNAPNRYEAQVAVFTDDLSANYVAALTPAEENTFQFSVDISTAVMDTISRLGTPVKQYLLSDLLKSNLDLSAVKLAVLPNAWNVPANIRQAIDTKLKTPGRTVLYLYAAGYINGDSGVSASNISSLTGINVVQGGGKPVLSQSYNVNGQTVSGGPAYALTPWFSINDPGAATLGTYNAGGVSLARKVISVAGGSYTSVVAAAPKLPLDVLRKLSEDAGVHHFTAKGEIVEAAGNMVMVHAGSDGNKTINFPQTMSRIFETGLWPSDNLMCNNCATLSQLPFSKGDTRVFRWTSAPVGNFELISAGPTLEGWAVDFDKPATSLAIDVYAGGPYNAGGVFFTSFVANAPRPDLTAVYGIPGNNGFRVNVGSCPSGTPLYAYATDPEGPNADSNSFIGTHTCP